MGYKRADMEKEIVKDDIVQITNKNNPWFPCLVIVQEIKSFGLQGYTTIPKKGDAYIRLHKEDYELVGKAKVVAE